MSGLQQQFSGEPTCRLPSISALGHRQVGYLALGSRPVGSPANCRRGADRSAMSGVGEQTCRLLSISALWHRQVVYLALGSRPVSSPANCRQLPLGSRQVGYLAFWSRPVGSPAYRRWGADRSVPQKIAVGGPTCQ